MRALSLLARSGGGPEAHSVLTDAVSAYRRTPSLPPRIHADIARLAAERQAPTPETLAKLATTVMTSA
jgi:hypothetical protein